MFLYVSGFLLTNISPKQIHWFLLPTDITRLSVFVPTRPRPMKPSSCSWWRRDWRQFFFFRKESMLKVVFRQLFFSFFLSTSFFLSNKSGLKSPDLFWPFDKSPYVGLSDQVTPPEDGSALILFFCVFDQFLSCLLQDICCWYDSKPNKPIQNQPFSTLRNADHCGHVRLTPQFLGRSRQLCCQTDSLAKVRKYPKVSWSYMIHESSTLQLYKYVWNQWTRFI